MQCIFMNFHKLFCILLQNTFSIVFLHLLIYQLLLGLFLLYFQIFNLLFKATNLSQINILNLLHCHLTLRSFKGFQKLLFLVLQIIKLSKDSLWVFIIYLVLLRNLLNPFLQFFILLFHPCYLFFILASALSWWNELLHCLTVTLIDLNYLIVLFFEFLDFLLSAMNFIVVLIQLIFDFLAIGSVLRVSGLI